MENTASPVTPVPLGQAPVDAPCHSSETMFSGVRKFLLHRLHRWLTLAMIRGSTLETEETLQHRLHRCLLGTLIGALLSDCHSVRMSTATIWF